ncbi:hypothetical protein [Burkholderia sp.]|uniref:hypothetical protein n=1 Tax=Burkholderia sp. TaxID=36773 RepID=UPI0025C6B41F|nr:hypothetical protein [Burkholderia sp.]MBS6360157.1 hypothetical protein [Burkholderia sp.]
MRSTKSSAPRSSAARHLIGITFASMGRLLHRLGVRARQADPPRRVNGVLAGARWIDIDPHKSAALGIVPGSHTRQAIAV